MTTFRWADIVRRTDACHVAFVDASSSSGWVRHRHDYYEVFRVDSGRGWHWCERQAAESPLEAGDVFFIRPSDGHGFRAEASSEPFAFANIAFPAAAWDDLARRYGWGKGGVFDLAVPIPPAHRTEGTADRALAALFREMLHVRPSRAALDWFLLSLTRAFGREQEQTPGADTPAWLRRAMAAYVRDEHGYNRGPHGLAQLAGCTPSHLSRSFRRHVGTTAIEWILAVRLKRACRLLESTGYSITDVAAMSGFENLSNFHRRFRERYSETPRTFRSRVRQVLQKGS